MKSVGLVLVGGGARGAYQAGVLKGLGEILGKRYQGRPFLNILTGISAGSINVGYLAAQADRMVEGTEGLHALWRGLSMDQVFRTSTVSFMSIGTRWMRDLTLGGALPSSRVRSNYLLDTAPLRKFLTKNIDFDAIRSHIRRDILHGFAVSATNYNTGTAVTFFDGHGHIKTWIRSARIGRRTHIGLEHVLASAAIPILFKPVEVEGSHYGDGGIRMSTPLSPPIHLGADRVLAISIRHPRPGETTHQMNATPREEFERGVSVADIAGVMLNAAFFDGLDSDAERMTRINETIALIDEHKRSKFDLRPIPLLVIRPSVDLGALATNQFKRFPRALRYMMKGIGASDDRGSDFMSYLAFDPSYTQPLLDIGVADAHANRDQIEELFS